MQTINRRSSRNFEITIKQKDGSLSKARRRRILVFSQGGSLNPSTEFTHSDARIVSFGRLRNTARSLDD